METYTALERSMKKKSYTRAAAVIGIFATIYGLIKMELPLIFMGVTIIYVLLYKKIVVIDEIGMTTHYHAIFYKKSTSYPFTAFQAIRVEMGNGPEAAIGLVRKGMTYTSIFTRDDAEAVIRLALEGNPDLKYIESRSRNR